MALAVVLVFPEAAAADDTPCTPGDLTCVGVGAGDAGSPASGGDDGGSGGGRQGGGATGGSTKPDPCAKYPGGYHLLCATATGAQCLSLYDQYYGTMPLAQYNALVTENNCPALAAGPEPPPPTPAELAEQAAASFHLPLPSGHRSPNENKRLNGYPFTYINLWTFYWTDPGTWHQFTATARAGANYATVTATPTSLTFNPGDGSSAASCAGPGRPWENSDGNSAPSAGACGYQYKRITGPGYEHPVTSTQTITWELTWTGSNNTIGTLTRRTTATTGPLNVLQIQTVNR